MQDYHPPDSAVKFSLTRFKISSKYSQICISLLLGIVDERRVQTLRVRVESEYQNFESGLSPGKFLFSKSGPGTKTSSPDSFRVLESSENLPKMTPQRIFIAFLLTNILKNFKFCNQIFLELARKKFQISFQKLKGFCSEKRPYLLEIS